jgi:hypothetical protein
MGEIKSENSGHWSEVDYDYEVHFWRYLLIWILIWVVVTVLSTLPEFIPGMVTLDPGDDPQTCPGIPFPLSSIGSWLGTAALFEAVCGLIWALLSYFVHEMWLSILSLRLCEKRLFVIATLLSALSVASTIGWFLGDLYYENANFSLCTEWCPTVINHAVILEEAIAIPCAFALSTIAAGISTTR